MRALALGLSLLMLSACDDTIFSNGHKGGIGDGGSGDGGADGGGTDGGTSADQGWCAVQRVFSSQCLACHSTAYPSGNLDLQADPYTAIVGVPSSLYAGQVLVVAGDPSASFLLSKVSNTQTADQGGAMPPSAGLDKDKVALIRTWIAKGASSECDGPTDTGGDTGTPARYHPKGFADQFQHGLEAKLHEQTCTDCHGADLTGGAGLSCDTCHPSGWRTDCTFCHGGTENATGAPPQSIRDDRFNDTAFGVHTRHVEENTHAAYDCTQCHQKPTDVLSAGHMFDSTAGQAEVTFSAGLSSAGSWSASAFSCSNLYCHGNGQGNNGRVAVADAPLSCSSCHADSSSGRDGWDLMSGAHDDHLREGISCADCHNGTTTDGRTIATPSQHVNGTKDIAFSTSAMSRSGSTCTGTCHGEYHGSRRWDD